MTMKLLLALFTTSSAFQSTVKVRSTKKFLTTMSAVTKTKQLVVDPFCFRQFQECEKSKDYGGTVL